MDYITQIILAARDNDSDDWVNIVFVVVLAAFWLIGGILKARANKTRQEDDQPGSEPSEQDSDVRIGARTILESLYRSQTQRPLGPTTQKKAPAYRAAAEPEPVRPILDVQQERPIKAIEHLQTRTNYADLLTGKPQPKSIAKSLLDLKDPEQLRRAILHYEILGKPVSLREPE